MKHLGWWPISKQLLKRATIEASRIDHPAFRIAVVISSSPGVVLPVPKIALLISYLVISGKERVLKKAISALRDISPISAAS